VNVHASITRRVYPNALMAIDSKMSSKLVGSETALPSSAAGHGLVALDGGRVPSDVIEKVANARDRRTGKLRQGKIVDIRKIQWNLV
jgi:hypothetical protein